VVCKPVNKHRSWTPELREANLCWIYFGENGGQDKPGFPIGRDRPPPRTESSALHQGIAVIIEMGPRFGCLLTDSRQPSLCKKLRVEVALGSAEAARPRTTSDIDKPPIAHKRSLGDPRCGAFINLGAVHSYGNGVNGAAKKWAC